jgi:hypothetical protein
MNEGFITSRGFQLPSDPGEMASTLWFNMWQPRLWPYKELDEGATLYWYCTKERAIVWRSRVIQVERFEYLSKDEVRKRFESDFGVTNLNDSYFDKAKDRGYCLAYKVDSLVPLTVPKPAEVEFPMLGWLRCSDADAAAWLEKLPSPSSPDGSFADELSATAAQVAEAGYFSPGSLQDQRKKKMREIIERRGQPDFRNKLIATYAGRCVVTGCDAVAALEAAHIVPYTGPQSNHVTNGLLLRADIHTLFDIDLIGIDPETLTIILAPAIQATVYAELQGRKITLPSKAANAPNHEALVERWKRFAEGAES